MTFLQSVHAIVVKKLEKKKFAILPHTNLIPLDYTHVTRLRIPWCAVACSMPWLAVNRPWGDL